jgi:hypothetical protein
MYFDSGCRRVRSALLAEDSDCVKFGKRAFSQSL